MERVPFQVAARVFLLSLSLPLCFIGCSFWDDWMRLPEQRKGRDCIYPEISRTFTFGAKVRLSLSASLLLRVVAGRSPSLSRNS